MTNGPLTNRHQGCKATQSLQRCDFQSEIPRSARNDNVTNGRLQRFTCKRLQLQMVRSRPGWADDGVSGRSFWAVAF